MGTAITQIVFPKLAPAKPEASVISGVRVKVTSAETNAKNQFARLENFSEMNSSS